MNSNTPLSLSCLTRLWLLAAAVALVSGCSSYGWVDKSSSTSVGTYKFRSGLIYRGGFNGDSFQGTGTKFYRYEAGEKYYEGSADMPEPGALDGVEFTAEYANDKILTARPASIIARKGENRFVYEGPYGGIGVVKFNDGRVLKATFATESVGYVRIVYRSSTQERYIWSDNYLLGANMSGYSTMTWPDGSSFEGSIYKYPLFHRGGSNYEEYCADGRLAGKGILKRPGMPDFVGFVIEPAYGKHLPEPSTLAKFNSYVDAISDCPRILSAARSGDTNFNRRQASNESQARQAAAASLDRDLAKLSSNIGRQMADVGAASRGSSVAAEQAKADRDTRFYAGIAAQQEDPNSEYNRDKRENERKAEAERRESEQRASKQALERNRQQAANEARAASDAAAERDAAAAVVKAKKQQDLNDAAALQTRLEAERAAQAKAKALRDQAEHDRAVAAEAAREKAEEDKRARAEERARSDYLDAVKRGLKLGALHCPGEGAKHFVVGRMPKIKPEVVSCIDVSYAETCPGERQGSSGVITSFVGASTDCFMGDAATVSPTPSCKPSEATVRVTSVTACVH